MSQQSERGREREREHVDTCVYLKTDVDMRVGMKICFLTNDKEVCQTQTGKQFASPL